MERLPVNLYEIQPLDAINTLGDRLTIFADGVVLNLEFWDCECDDHYIRPLSEDTCPHCGSKQEEMPSSREREVIAWRETGSPLGKKMLPSGSGDTPSAILG